MSDSVADPKVHSLSDQAGYSNTSDENLLQKDSYDFTYVKVSDLKWNGRTTTISITVAGSDEDKVETREVCTWSLLPLPFLNIKSTFRKKVIAFIKWKWFDFFILFLIFIGSILDATQPRREPSNSGYNKFLETVADPVLLGFYTVELVLKVTAWGVFLSPDAYLMDYWNWLDFIVVVAGWLPYITKESAGLGFLRLFRVLRPLRTLNKSREMKKLVNTVLSSIPKLGNVALFSAFLFTIFAIIGLTMMQGLFYRVCRKDPHPTLDAVRGCWTWDLVDGASRLCGGRYMCESGETCGGHEFDINEGLRPFSGSRSKGAYPWCDSNYEKHGGVKMSPEYDFIHFDNIFAAFLVVFQCMTMEGWTPIMYAVQDGLSLYLGTIYFFLLIPATSFFLVNVALAVVDEANKQPDEDEVDGAEELVDYGDMKTKVDDIPDMLSDQCPVPISSVPEDEDDGVKREDLWYDCYVVRKLHEIATDDIFGNTIMFFISVNVVVMMLEKYPADTSMETFMTTCEIIFLVIFSLEMIIMVGGFGPKKYVTTPAMLFDGVIVIVSVVQVAMPSVGNSISALRTLRLFRVLNKFASRWRSFRVMLRAMWKTAIALNYWLVLFALFMFMMTLMWMELFATKFRFQDPGTLDRVLDDKGLWCPGTDGLSWHFRQDCIPEAHFDTFLWGFVTMFQLMTGENWNTVMYASMRALKGAHPIGAIIYALLIVFGQNLFLNLFLSMLIEKFDIARDEIDREETSKAQLVKRHNSRKSMGILLNSFRSSFTGTKIKQVEPNGNETKDVPPSKVVVKPKEEHLNGEKDIKDRGVRLPGVPDQQNQDDEMKVASAAKKQEIIVSNGTIDTATAPTEVTDHSIDEDEPLATKPSSSNNSSLTPSWVKAILSRKGWPTGYAWFVFHTDNPLRQALQKFLELKVSFRGSSYQLFDNFILLCILLSTILMAAGSPLDDPGTGGMKFIKYADYVFAVIFISEMVIKLCAYGLIWGERAYLKDGWNWLDAIVVMVTIIGFTNTDGGNSFLKTLRILRAFRPLRVINKYPTLKTVVETIFASVKELSVLSIVIILFLIIFALIMLSELNGAFYKCSDPPSGTTHYFSYDFASVEQSFVPLCVDRQYSAGMPTFCTSGQMNTGVGLWSSAGCAGHCNTSQLTAEWRRASWDTPMCVGRCNPYQDETAEHRPSLTLCPKRYTKVEELPSKCGGVAKSSMTAAEQRGQEYVEAMQRKLVLPCGGNMLQNGQVVQANVTTCRQVFCPTGVTSGVVESCRDQCKVSKSNFFCYNTCEKNENSAECQACRAECQASCECSDYCEPLMKDAALCIEQGGSWELALPHNFDNIANAMLTLFEILTTEGWVDVMYAACASTGAYMQPKRDTSQWIWAPIFCIYMFLSFFFLFNVAVGLIVQKFCEKKEEQEEEGNKHYFSSKAQEQLVNFMLNWGSRSVYFPLTNLDRLPKVQRIIYHVISHRYFERGIMGAILTNALIMALKWFPEPTNSWNDALKTLNLMFAILFIIEFLLKIIALHEKYFWDRWNRFDFTCILLWAVGFILGHVSSGSSNVNDITQVVRIFRLIRLLRYHEGMRKISMSFILAVPKLVNVGAILILILILYSILGMNLFGVVKLIADDPANANGSNGYWGYKNEYYGNFRNFLWAFITLFRASTGEAWNEIMHDLARTEKDHFESGSWCTPNDLYAVHNVDGYNTLKSKCLAGPDYPPNACVAPLFGIKGIWPVIYWMSYILIIWWVVMNLVIAVILEAYDQGQKTSEADAVDTCLEKWKKYDENLSMSIPFHKAILFINECVEATAPDQKNDKIISIPQPSTTTPGTCSCGVDLRTIPMKYANGLQMKMTEDGNVRFEDALPQVYRFAAACGDVDQVQDIEDEMQKFITEEHTTDKRAKALYDTYSKRAMQDDQKVVLDVKELVAATKLQRTFRRRKKRERSEAASDKDGDDEKDRDKIDLAAEDSSEELRAAACGEKAKEPTGWLTPPNEAG